MPWGTSKKALKSNKQYFKTRRLVNEKARVLHESHVKKIIGEELKVLHAALAWRAIDLFKDENDLWETSILLVLVIDTYKVFTKRDAYLWGLAYNQQNLYRLIAYTKERGLIDEINSNRSRTHYLTLKGKKLVSEFNKFYKQRAKLIFKSNANGNQNLIYKYATLKPKGGYKLDDTVEG